MSLHHFVSGQLPNVVRSSKQRQFLSVKARSRPGARTWRFAGLLAPRVLLLAFDRGEV
jgi:hypothetical protein